MNLLNDRRKTKLGFQIVLVCASITAGILAPYLIRDGYFRYPVNLFWGPVFGFGWYAAGLVVGISHPLASWFGGMAWPIIVSLAVWIACGRIWEMNVSPKSLYLVVLLVSLMLFVPHRFYRNFVSIPTYFDTLESIY
jgi:hypothetical protein